MVAHHDPPTNEADSTQVQFEVENLPVESGGREVAYSVTMKSWGLGNFWSDHIIQTASLSQTLQPGTSTTVTVDNLASILGVRSTDMPAKGDIVVGLHAISGGVVESEPFAYLRLPQFFYHFSDDLSKVYTYSYAITSDPAHPVGVSDLFTWYKNACGGTCGGSTFVTYSQFRNGAPSSLHTWLNGLAAAHGVD